MASGRYQARWWDEAQRKRVAAPKTFTWKADASLWLAQKEAGLLDEAEVEEEPTPVVPTLGSYAEDWMATRTLRPGTQALYRSQLRRHLLPTFGEVELDAILPVEVRRWYAGRIETGLSTVTVAKQYRLLRAILSTAVDDGLITTNPCQIRGGGVERSPERTIPTIADVTALADGLPADLRAVPWIAALAGLRKGEILALARRHIDIEGARISVTRSLQEITGVGAVLSPTKSTSGVRVVAIPQRLVDILEVHLADHVKPDPDSLLFSNTYGREIRASLWTPAWDSAREAAGVDVRLHDLRHLAGTLTAQAGATLREIMDRLGHSSPQAAMRYQHVALERNERIARAIDDLLDAEEDNDEAHGS
ncbi:MAG: site-specific integrase [Acidimicrobiales bacterium]|nr:site-specific integrase [Acidimicrobiales bacterium]